MQLVIDERVYAIYTVMPQLVPSILWMGSCPIKWLVSMVNINEPIEAAEHSWTEMAGFESHKLHELEAITVDSVDGVTICVGDVESYDRVD